MIAVKYAMGLLHRCGYKKEWGISRAEAVKIVIVEGSINSCLGWIWLASLAP